MGHRLFSLVLVTLLLSVFGTQAGVNRSGSGGGVPSGRHLAGPGGFQGTSDITGMPRNTFSEQDGNTVDLAPGAGMAAVPKSDAKSLPSLPKLFGISLLWIPFNRWKKKK